MRILENHDVKRRARTSITPDLYEPQSPFPNIYTQIHCQLKFHKHHNHELLAPHVNAAFDSTASCSALSGSSSSRTGPVCNSGLRFWPGKPSWRSTSEAGRESQRESRAPWPRASKRCQGQVFVVAKQGQQRGPKRLPPAYLTVSSSIIEQGIFRPAQVLDMVTQDARQQGASR